MKPTFLILLACIALINPFRDEVYAEGTVCANWTTENAGIPEKMCWAHFCGWGFNVVERFDQPDYVGRLYDRTLLGEQVGTDLGVTSSTRIQIRTAMEYGINGFCVDIPRLDGYTSIGRFYKAAEGLSFKIALCVDGWEGEIAEVVNALASLFEAYGDHPNNVFIEGRPVVFIYRAGRPVVECEEILHLLAERGHRPYWLVQPQHETTLWDDAETMEAYLEVFDGLYDFGVNGYPLDKMKLRLSNGRKALASKRPGGVLCAGISRGYLGPHNGFYRPYLGTGTLRDNWAAALESNTDWVCLCTWNDYNETTHFEPSVWGRDSLLKLNAEYLRQWRGEPMPNRPPRVIVSYREEACLGDDVTIEVLNLPYTTSNACCHVRLLDMDGHEQKYFPPVALARDRIQAHTLRLEAPGLSPPRRLRVQATITTGSPGVKPDSWLELYPVIIRPGTLRAWRTLTIDLCDIFEGPTVKVTDNGGKTAITASFPSWSWWGKADLIRNGVEVRSQEIAKFGPITTDVRFVVNADDQRTPEDTYVIRLDRKDWKVAFSPPVVIKRQGMEPAGDITLPVIVRGADSDEAWGDRPWRTPWRLSQPEIRQVTLPSEELFQIHLQMDADTGAWCADTGGWGIPAQRGNASRWGAIDADLQPQWVRTDGPGGSERVCLRFDGVNDNITLPFRTLPHGPLTVEVRFRLKESGRPMTLFCDQNGGLTLSITEEGHPRLARSDVSCEGANILQSGQWHHLAGIYDGTALAIVLDGETVNTINAPPTIRAINSRPVIGASVRNFRASEPFLAADLAGFTISVCPALSSHTGLN